MAQVLSIHLIIITLLVLRNDIIIWFLYYLLYLVILLSAISIKIYKIFNFNNYELGIPIFQLKKIG